MSITFKAWQNQTVTPEELARAIWNGNPENAAWLLFHLFDIAHKSNTPKDEREEKLEAIAAACVPRGLLPRIEDLSHRIARHKRESEAKT